MPKRKTKKSTQQSSNKKNLFNLNFFLYSSVSFITITALSLTAMNVTKFLDKQKVLGVSASNMEVVFSPTLEDEKKFWEGIIEKNPSYRDGYLELAHIEYKLGNKTEAKNYFSKAKELDPNSQSVISFESLYLK